MLSDDDLKDVNGFSCLTFSCSMFFLCCLIFFTSSGRSGIPFPASSSCSAAYSRQKAPVRPTPELRQTDRRTAQILMSNTFLTTITNKLKRLQTEEVNICLHLYETIFIQNVCRMNSFMIAFKMYLIQNIIVVHLWSLVFILCPIINF